MLSLFRKKSPNQVELNGRPDSIEVSAGATLLEALLDAGIDMPHDCKVGSCGTCKYRLDAGKIAELSPSALALSREEIASGYRLACQSLPRSDLRISVDRLGDRLVEVENFTARIVAAPLLSHDIIGLRLQLDRPLSFVAGQYAEIACDAVAGARTYSISNAPRGQARDILEFHVRKVPGGAFTEWLFAQDRTGTDLRLTGPGGSFRHQGGEGAILCIAGGSGLAPILSLLEEAHWSGASSSVTLLYGARAERDLYCRAEIAELAAKWRGNFEYLPVLSEEPVTSDWSGARGLVADRIASISDLAAHQCYICGPPPMVDAAERLLLSGGVPGDAILADRFFDRSRP
jgi:NAD(P)H-flavin reductase/ferredoxin